MGIANFLEDVLSVLLYINLKVHFFQIHPEPSVLLKAALFMVTSHNVCLATAGHQETVGIVAIPAAGDTVAVSLL